MDEIESLDVEILSGGSPHEIEMILRGSGHFIDPPKVLQVALASHEGASVHWTATFTCSRTALETSEEWRGTARLEEPQPRLLEVTEIKEPLEIEENCDPSLTREYAFAPALHLEAYGRESWVTGAAAEAERDHRLEAREAYFDEEMLSPTATLASMQYSAVLLATNVHVSTAHRVPGLILTPLSNATLGSDLTTVFNELLPQLEYNFHIDPDIWLAGVRQHSPSAVIQVPKIRAISDDDAQNYVINLVSQFLDVTALRRHARPMMLGGVLFKRDSAGNLQGRPWNSRPGYRGNLATGFIAGEDPDRLLAIWKATQHDARLRLWLSMYADALAETQPDYRFFRAFNLLETIADQFIIGGKTIIDDSGKRMMMDAKRPYTTTQVRGKLFEFFRLVSSKEPISISSFTTPNYVSKGSNFVQEPGNLWDELADWVKIRNTVAHDGTFRIAQGRTPDKARLQLEKRIGRYSFNGTGLGTGFNALLMTISHNCETVLHNAIRGRI